MAIRSGLALTTACLVLAASSEGRAAEPACSVLLQPSGAHQGWVDAVESLRMHLAELSDDSVDCREITIHLTSNGAVVAFKTRDGRAAIRQIATPAELLPTIDAMLVTTGLAAPIEPPPPAASSGPSPKEPAADRPESGRVTPSDHGTGFLVGVLLGTRVGWPGRYISPLVGVSAAVFVRNWEVGVFGAWEAGYSTAGNVLPPGVSLSAIAAGAHVGRRFGLGKQIALVTSAELGGAIVNEEGDSQSDSLGGAQAEARAALKLDLLLLPSSARYRFRPSLGFDIVPSRFGRNPGVDPSLPPPPKWALSLTLAFETEAL